jgi:hypothetical protein
MMFHQASERRLRRRRAELIEDVATAFGGTQSKKGLAAMTKTLAALRKD